MSQPIEDKSEKTRQQIHSALMDLSDKKHLTTLLALNFNDRCYITHVTQIFANGRGNPPSNLLRSFLENS